MPEVLVHGYQVVYAQLKSNMEEATCLSYSSQSEIRWLVEDGWNEHNVDIDPSEFSRRYFVHEVRWAQLPRTYR